MSALYALKPPAPTEAAIMPLVGKGRQKESRNPNRMGGTSARADGSRPHGSNALFHRWRALQDRTGLKRVHLYALRHTASMLFGRSGADVKTTQGLMGHADVRTTLKIYTHFEEERAREAVERLDGMLDGLAGGSPDGDSSPDLGANADRNVGSGAEEG